MEPPKSTFVPKGKKRPLDQITNISNNKRTNLEDDNTMKTSQLPRPAKRQSLSLGCEHSLSMRHDADSRGTISRRRSMIPIPTTTTSRYEDINIQKYKSDGNRAPNFNKRNTLAVSTLTPSFQRSSIPKSAKFVVSRDKNFINRRKMNHFNIKGTSNTNACANSDCNNNNEKPQKAAIDGNNNESKGMHSHSEMVNPADYAAMLDIQTMNDIAIEKRQVAELLRSINSTQEQLKSLDFEKRETMRGIRTFKGMIEDYKLSYENLDRTLIIKQRAVQNEVSQAKKLMDQKQKRVVEHHEQLLNDKEMEFKALIERSMEDDVDDSTHKANLEKLKNQISDSQRVNERLVKNNELELKRTVNQTNSNVEKEQAGLTQELKLLRDEYHKSELDLKKLNGQLSELEKVISGQDLTITNLTEGISDMSKFTGSLDKAVSDMKLKILNLQSEIDLKEHDIKELLHGEFALNEKEHEESYANYMKEKLQSFRLQNHLFDAEGKCHAWCKLCCCSILFQ
ncbi:unnamed protein product [Ambrosiozyma monospora]|uniref:Unnamed protein product n=1 Tax=Ambrosiozyma monospora TaxID=43982 RepID=A0A9W6YW01_AMBMO|nr:unnamed protein product [Ambrosiozyma monospora]